MYYERVLATIEHIPNLTGLPLTRACWEARQPTAAEEHDTLESLSGLEHPKKNDSH